MLKFKLELLRVYKTLYNVSRTSIPTLAIKFDLCEEKCQCHGDFVKKTVKKSAQTCELVHLKKSLPILEDQINAEAIMGDQPKGHRIAFYDTKKMKNDIKSIDNSK